MSEPAWETFPDREALAQALAERTVQGLGAGIEARGRATLAVSGGSTPVRLFERLAEADLDWSSVWVTLVDERWVGPADPRSNARLVGEHLLQDRAASARFVGLYTGDGTPDEGRATAEARVAALARPFDAVVLGMGADGHTASFFPGGDRLEAAIDPQSERLVETMTAPGAGEPRITLTLAALLDTGLLALHVEGEEKRHVLEAAFGEGAVSDLPVRAVLGQQATPVTIYWCP